MKFSIVTPSFKQHNWLRLCVASVADQEGVKFEHIVQDGGGAAAGEALRDWTPNFPNLRVFAESDSGMYGAINQGLRRATGDICAYLNCDEQYLPGALRHVQQAFEEDPTLDLVFGDALVVDGAGRYICHRQSLVPRLHHTISCHLAVLSCVIFFHRRLVEQGLLFDTSYRFAGDGDWIVRCIESGVRMDRTPHLLATFTDLGTNLGLDRGAGDELRRIQGRFPAWWPRLAFIWAVHHRFRRWRAGYYRPIPTRYAIHTLKEPHHRTEFLVSQPISVWKSRHKWNGGARHNPLRASPLQGNSAQPSVKQEI